MKIQTKLMEAYIRENPVKSGLPNSAGGRSRGPPGPDFLQVNKKSRFLEEGGGQGPHQLEIQILFLYV